MLAPVICCMRYPRSFLDCYVRFISFNDSLRDVWMTPGFLSDINSGNETLIDTTASKLHWSSCPSLSHFLFENGHRPSIFVAKKERNNFGSVRFDTESLICHHLSIMQQEWSFRSPFLGKGSRQKLCWHWVCDESRSESLKPWELHEHPLSFEIGACGAGMGVLALG
jgi:hypothetical protein